MTRRHVGHDYESRRMYLITITVKGRRPLLGAVVGNPKSRKGKFVAEAFEKNRKRISPFERTDSLLGFCLRISG